MPCRRAPPMRRGGLDWQRHLHSNCYMRCRRVPPMWRGGLNWQSASPPSISESTTYKTRWDHLDHRWIMESHLTLPSEIVHYFKILVLLRSQHIWCFKKVSDPLPTSPGGQIPLWTDQGSHTTQKPIGSNQIPKELGKHPSLNPTLAYQPRVSA